MLSECAALTSSFRDMDELEQQLRRAANRRMVLSMMLVWESNVGFDKGDRLVLINVQAGGIFSSNKTPGYKLRYIKLMRHLKLVDGCCPASSDQEATSQVRTAHEQDEDQ